MYVIEPDGDQYSGYEGFLRVARVVPSLWPSLVIGNFPGIRQLGRAIYRFIAANRMRRGGCTDEFRELRQHSIPVPTSESM
jgi:predicted DCC family thiol-disulfide oxidoreductase YuxK